MIRQLWPLTLGAFVLGLDAFALAWLLPGMAYSLGTTQASVGLGVAMFTAAYAVSAPTLAFFAEKYSTRTALLIGLAVFTLGNVATMLAPSLAVLLVARLVAGVGAGLYSPLASISAANSVEVKQRGRALSMVLAGLSTGTALGVPKRGRCDNWLSGIKCAHIRIHAPNRSNSGCNCSNRDSSC